jgi:transcriptional regulator with XRE-family HTH domain
VSPDTIASTLREARRTGGVTQIELHKRSGISQSEISAVEHGRFPTIVTLVRLSLALGLDPAEVLRNAVKTQALKLPNSLNQNSRQAALLGFKGRTERMKVRRRATNRHVLQPSDRNALNA